MKTVIVDGRKVMVDKDTYLMYVQGCDKPKQLTVPLTPNKIRDKARELIHEHK